MSESAKRTFVVIGLGSFGSTVAMALADTGDEVLGIDIDEAAVRPLADTLSQALIADARDEDALKEAGVADYDVAVVAIGEDLEASILCTMNLKLLGVKCIWVKALSKSHHRILLKIEVDRIIQPERDMGLRVAETLHTPFISDYLSLGNGFYVVNIEVDDAIAGQIPADVLRGDGDVRLLGFMRGTEHHAATDPGLHLEEGDRLLVLGRRDGLRRFTRTLR